MALGDVIARLAVNLTMETAAFEEGATIAEKRLNQSSKRFEQLGERMTALGGKLSLAVTAPLGAFGVSAGVAASDAAELQGSFNQTFGSMSDTMNKWAEETGNALGRSTQEMQKAANTFGIFFNTAVDPAKAASMSQTFSQLAQDLGSFYNTDTDTAIEKLRAGLSGESEPLRDFGVFLTEASVQAKAMELGLTGVGNELTEQEKIVARYNLILEATRNAQGDVARTSGGTANQVRAAQAAFEELQVVIGTKLLPVVTPLITKVAELLNAFTALPDGVQTFVVGGAAAAAALGPIITGVGALVSAGSTLFAAFGMIGTAMASVGTATGAAQIGLAALSGAMAALGPVIAIVAGIAAAGYLIYENWDKIAPVLQDLWATLQETLGPPLQSLIGAVSDAFSALWNGPLGSMMEAADGLFRSFAGTVAQALGIAIVEAVKLAAKVIGGFMQQIADGVRMVTALFQGDWSAAWNLAAGIVNRAWGGLPAKVIGWMQQMVNGIRTWVVDRLNAVWDTVTGKIDAVSNAFFKLYDAVVGHSYVPDMVDGIAAQMQRLDAEFVNPADRAAATVGDKFEALRDRIQKLTAELFPEVAKRDQFRTDLDTIDAAEARGTYTPEQAAEARNRLLERSGALDGVNDLVRTAYPELAKAANDNAGGVEVANVRIAESFKDMVQASLTAVQNFASAIKGGGFLDIVSGIINLGLQLGSAGVFGSKVATAVNKVSVPGYASGTPSAAAGLALVGEQGPELVKFRGGERVYNNADTQAMMGGRAAMIRVEPSPYFDVVVDRRAAGVAAPMAGRAAVAGSTGAQVALARKQSRAIP